MQLWFINKEQIIWELLQEIQSHRNKVQGSLCTLTRVLKLLEMRGI